MLSMKVSRGDIIIKRWRWAELLDPPSEIRRRMRLIGRLSKQLPSIPETEYRRISPRRSCTANSRRSEADELRQLQRRIRPFRRVGADCSTPLLLSLAEDLDKISEAGLVHGDICPGNLCMDDERCYLIDWEPSFRQIKRGRRVPICTLPYIAPSERGTAGGLSSLSDKVAFVLSLSMIFGGSLPDHEGIVHIERELRTLSFRESIGYFMEKEVL